MQCQMCNQKPATVHLTEIVDGKKLERHLCELCAQKNGITINAQAPITEFLINNVLGFEQESRETGEIRCPQCDMTWAKFRKSGLLGCPNDYTAFEKVLRPLIDKTHEGATTHIGKVPTQAKGTLGKQIQLIRLRQDLQEAVGNEDYEAAARLRDQIRKFEH